jgi:ribosome-associated heat shock protein Hsp15
MDGVRLDKWLWAARFFKTRALAARACELGRVLSNGQPVKPAREIRVGNHFAITTEGGTYQVEVLGLSETRGPAAVAQTLYRESANSKEARAKAAEERKALTAWERLPDSRPDKRDRRTLSRLRGRY